MSVFDPLFQTFIPDQLRRDEASFTKAKNLIGLAVVAVLAAPPFAGLYYWLGNTGGAVAIGLVLPALTAGFLSMRLLGTLAVAQYSSMFTLYALFIYLTYSMGGNPATSVNGWYAAVPLVATFMLGLRQGLFWLGMTMVAMGFYAWAGLTGGMAFPANPVRDPRLLDIISNLGLVPFIGGLALFFQLAKDQSDRVRISQVGTIKFLIGEVSAQSAQVSGQVHGMVQALSHQSEQAMALRSASEVNHRLAAAVEQTSSNLAQEANAAKETALHGAEVVGAAITNSEVLAESINQADTLVRTLQSRSQEISSIVDKIKGLAFQTNILALNATIEAAHAGAQGRGFAVVADSVRKLAGEAGDAATDISRELSVVLDNIGKTAHLLGNSHQLAESGRLSGAKAKDSLQSILDSVVALNGDMARLKDVSHEQLSQNTELQTTASQMEQGIQQVADGSSSIQDAIERLNHRLAQVEA